MATQKTGEDNVLVTNDMIANEMLMLLENELVFLPMVNRSLESQLNNRAARYGGTLDVELPARVRSTSGRTLSKKPMIQQTTPVTIDQWEHVGLSFHSKDRETSITDDYWQRMLRSSASQLAHKLDAWIVQQMVKGFGNFVGVVEEDFHYDVGIDAWAKAMDLGIPSDGASKIVLNPLAAANYQKSLTQVNSDKLVRSAIERAYMGTIGNLPIYGSAHLPTHTPGPYTGSPAVVGANQTGTSIDLDGFGNSITGALKAGDIITFEDVFEVNPQTYQSTGQLRGFVVQADADSSGTGTLTVTISPGINDGGDTINDIDAAAMSTDAYQNVTAAPANDAAVTIIGTASTARRENVCFHRDSFMLAVLDMAPPETAAYATKVSNPRSGLSLLMTGDYDITEVDQTYRMDLVWGGKVVYPELGMRLYGKA